MLLITAACTSRDEPSLVDGPSDDETPLSAAYAAADGERPSDYQAQVEALIQQCMAEQGFDYIPVDLTLTELEPLRGLSLEQYRQEFGYGLSTEIEDGDQGNEQKFADPNDAIRENLGAEELEAYNDALLGKPSEAKEIRTEEGELIMVDNPNACINKSHATIDRPITDESVRAQAQLSLLIFELDERIASDSRVIDAQDAWSTCMTEAGYQFANPQGIEEDILLRLAEISSETDDGEVSFDQAALSSIQTYELEIAQQDEACRDEAEFARVLLEVRRAYETEFLTDGINSELLERATG